MDNANLRKQALQYDIDVPINFRSSRERASIIQLVLNTDNLVNQYISINGNYLNGDNAKHLFTNYTKLYDPDFDIASGNLIKLVFRKQLLLNSSGKNKEILFTGGGPGSGKSIATENLRGHQKFSFIYDSNLADFDRAVKYIEEAKKLEYKITISFVDRQIDAAYKYGVLQRFKEGNPRTVIINRHVKNHINSRNTLIRLYDKYLTDLKVVIVIIKNHGEKKDINTVEIDFLRDQVHNSNELKKNLYVYTKTEYTSGQFTKEQFEALTER